MKGFRKYLAEFIGTGVLVFVACGVAGQVCDVGGAGHLMTALAFGLVIVAMAYSIGNVSGCHINPAVSLAMLISKKMSVKEFIGYVVAQYLGATAGAGLLYAIVKNPDELGANGLAGGAEGSILISLAIEIALTFVFVLAILGVTSKEGNGAVAGLVIGGGRGPDPLEFAGLLILDLDRVPGHAGLIFVAGGGNLGVAVFVDRNGLRAFRPDDGRPVRLLGEEQLNVRLADRHDRAGASHCMHSDRGRPCRLVHLLSSLQK